MKKNKSVRVFFDDKAYKELQKVAKELGNQRISDIIRMSVMLGLLETRETGNSFSYLRLDNNSRKVAS